MKEKAIKIIATVFIVALVAFCMVSVSTPDLPTASRIFTAIRILTAAFTVYYLFYGCEKNAAGLFKIFAVLFIISQIGLCFFMFEKDFAAPCRIFAILSAVLAVVLNIPNLKKKNILFISCITVINVVYCIMLIVGGKAQFIITVGSQLVLLSGIYFTMILGKIADKKARGRI